MSPEDQRRRIEEACRPVDLTLRATYEEIDVSGGKPLEQRLGVLAGIEDIEAGRAHVLVVGYFDRLVRSVAIQGQIVSRVERAGGEVLAVDYGRITEGTASQWLSGTMLGAVHEYVRRSATEKSAEAQADAVARGVCPFPNVPPGLALDETNRVVEGEGIEVVADAFAMRAEGATIAAVRRFLAERGIERSYHGVQAMLGNRLYLGEIHFGKLVNLEAHDEVIDRGLFERVQAGRSERGRRAKSSRILARLGVLLCGNCGARMTVGTQRQHGRAYAFYRCPPVGDCEKRVTISAAIAEQVVVAATQARLADVEGSASIDREAREATAIADRAQADFDAAIRAFRGLEDETAAGERLGELRQVRDNARERAHHLTDLRRALTVTVADWERLTRDEQRRLIRSTVSRASVGPVVAGGTPADRVSIELFGE